MKKCLILSSLFTVIVAGCQFEVSPTVVPDVAARVSREILLSNMDGKTVIGEIIYRYNSAGNLIETKRYGKDGTGSLSVNSYEIYEYDSKNRVTHQLDYYRNQTAKIPDFTLNQEQKFQYTADNQITAQTYGYTSGKAWLRNWAETTTTSNGQPIRVSFYNAGNDGASRGTLSMNVTYVYENGRLAKQEYRNDRNELYQTNERRYKGRVAEVAITYPTQQQGFVNEVLEYDRRGRLIRQHYISGRITDQIIRIGIIIAPPIRQFEYND